MPTLPFIASATGSDRLTEPVAGRSGSSDAVRATAGRAFLSELEGMERDSPGQKAMKLTVRDEQMAKDEDSGLEVMNGEPTSVELAPNEEIERLIGETHARTGEPALVEKASREPLEDFPASDLDATAGSPEGTPLASPFGANPDVTASVAAAGDGLLKALPAAMTRLPHAVGILERGRATVADEPIRPQPTISFSEADEALGLDVPEIAPADTSADQTVDKASLSRAHAHSLIEADPRHQIAAQTPLPPGEGPAPVFHEDSMPRFDVQIGFGGAAAAAAFLDRASAVSPVSIPDLPARLDRVIDDLRMVVRNGGPSSEAMHTEIELAPAELGRLRISLETGERGLTLTVLAERPEALDAVRRHLDSLAKSLQAENITLHRLELGGDPGGGPSREGNGRASAGHAVPLARGGAEDGQAGASKDQPAAQGRPAALSDCLDIRL
jgi:hypothetical protein